MCWSIGGGYSRCAPADAKRAVFIQLPSDLLVEPWPKVCGTPCLDYHAFSNMKTATSGKFTSNTMLFIGKALAAVIYHCTGGKGTQIVHKSPSVALLATSR